MALNPGRGSVLWGNISTTVLHRVVAGTQASLQNTVHEDVQNEGLCMKPELGPRSTCRGRSRVQPAWEGRHSQRHSGPRPGALLHRPENHGIDCGSTEDCLSTLQTSFGGCCLPSCWCGVRLQRVTLPLPRHPVRAESGAPGARTLLLWAGGRRLPPSSHLVSAATLPSRPPSPRSPLQ